MGKRPRSLTIVGWWLLISALFGIYSALTAQSNPVVMDAIAKSGMSLTSYRASGIFTALLIALSGYGILVGQPWSRLLYLVHCMLSLMMTVFIASAMTTALLTAMLVMEGLIMLLILYFLFRSAADRWFAADWLQLRRG